MIDIHTHILYNVDDGSDTIDESVALLKSASKAGITDVILTPHYTDSGSVGYNNSGVKENFELLKAKIEQEKIDINIYLGNEVAIYGNIVEILNSKVVNTLAKTKYMLIEFPMNVDVTYVIDTVYEIKLRGLVPIIAHPERCLCFEKNSDLVEEAIYEGALIQINMGSLFGKYGNTAKQISRELIEDNFVHFIATDTHSLRNNKYNDLEKMQKKLKRIIGEEKLYRLTVHNQELLLKNKDI